ncbi:MAG: hypothetical protein R8P61_37565 [Bacteroidia bacterium]|nr:hypothetical protein [Bacteroidia bacterium]
MRSKEMALYCSSLDIKSHEIMRSGDQEIRRFLWYSLHLANMRAVIFNASPE